MWTFLFDIDGTLLRTRGAGWKAIERVMKELHDVDEVPKIPVGGRTDKGIFSDIFTAAGISNSRETYDEFRFQYHEYLPAAMHETGAILLPGVTELLKSLSELPNVAMGLLTGNSQAAARVKVNHFELGQYFNFGGYGDDHEHRGKVAAAAVSAAREKVPMFDLSKAWVIGDTIHDITCANEVGAKVAAVMTGSGSKEELVSQGPDLIYEDLADYKAFVSDVMEYMN